MYPVPCILYPHSYRVKISFVKRKIASLFSISNAVDIITMSTHGLSGIKRCVFGRVTDKVLHSGDMPIFVARAREQ